MDPWSIGLAALVVVGLAAVVFGALFDRARNRRRTLQMLAPPPRAIPRFSPEAPPPRYLSDLQARRAPTGAPRLTALTAAERTEIDEQLADPGTPTVSAGYASSEFVTDRSAGWVVLDEPVVCVCADEVTSIRELLGLLERLVLSRTPLVLVAPAVARDVLGTLEVNRIQQRLAVVVVLVPDAAERARVAQLCGGQLVDRPDRQAGYLPPEALGRCGRWVSTARASHVLTRRTATA